MKRHLKNFSYYYIFLHLIASVISVIVMFMGFQIIGYLTLFLCVMLEYFLLKKKLKVSVIHTNFLIFSCVFILFTLFMIITKGNINGVVFQYFSIILFPFFPFLLIGSLMDQMSSIYFFIFILLGLEVILPSILLKKYKYLKLLLVLCLLVPVNGFLYYTRDEAKYGGHGFEYMHGYSSTNFSDYTVYNPKKLAVLDEESSLMIEDNYPVLDGAEACYPLYSAVAKAVYKDIDSIEKEYKNERTNGKYVRFTNTIYAYNDLIYGNVDVAFGARPSLDQIEMAREMGVEFEITPIGKEAFVFFVEEYNPISTLTIDEIKGIYHGTFTNFKELGGKDQEIVAFQRPANSGSQTMMEYFMNDVSLKEPKTYETFESMMGVVQNVAQYHDEKGAMGYSFRYFVEELNQEKNVKLLDINGISPTLDNIENGSYPLCVDLCMITIKGNNNENVAKLIDFMTSKQGQELVYKTGYGRLNG